MISVINKRVFAKAIDILIVHFMCFSISWGIDNDYLTDSFKVLPGLIFLFFTLTIELLDKENKSLGKMLFGLSMDFPESKIRTKLNVLVRRPINFLEVYSSIGLFVLYLNNGKTITDLATGSKVY